MSLSPRRSTGAKFLLFLWLLVFAAPALVAPASAQITDEDIRNLDQEDPSDEPKDKKEPSDNGALALFLKMISSLALVLALLLFAGYLIKRYAKTQAPQGRRPDAIHVVGTKMLGGRRSLMLVRVRGQTLLLGLTPQSINYLTEIHEVEGEWAQPAEAEGQVASSFEHNLGKFINQTVPETSSKPS